MLVVASPNKLPYTHIDVDRYEGFSVRLSLDHSKVLAAFFDETRLTILELLRGGEKCASNLLEQVNIGQSTLSHHMKVLVKSGIVTSRKAHKWTYYSISESGKGRVIEMLKQLESLFKNEVTEQPKLENTDLRRSST